MRGRRRIAEEKGREIPEASQEYRRGRKMLTGLTYLLLGVAFLFLIACPRLSLSIGRSIDRRDPFLTPFIFKNDGYLPLYNVRYSLVIEDMSGDIGTLHGTISKTGENIKKLKPRKSTTISLNKIILTDIPKPINFATIHISVTCRPSLIPFRFSRDIRLRTERMETGRYVWLEVRGEENEYYSKLGRYLPAKMNHYLRLLFTRIGQGKPRK